jgi:hypothetical protein
MARHRRSFVPAYAVLDPGPTPMPSECRVRQVPLSLGRLITDLTRRQIRFFVEQFGMLDEIQLLLRR